MEIFIDILTAVLTLGIISALVGMAIELIGREEKKEPEPEPVKAEKLCAFVKCNGGDCEKKYTYADVSDCYVAAELANGPNSCSFSCMGLGNCSRVCPNGAISVESGVAVVSEEKCTGCGACTEACPRGIIELVPPDKKFRVQCSKRENTKIREESCETGCIGCGACANTCQYEAVTVVDGLAAIDYEKCTGCGACAEECLTKVITVPGRKIEEEPFDESEYFSIEVAEENENGKAW